MMMNNGDMPAMPQSFALNDQECGSPITHFPDESARQHIGLTKREMFAMAAMQGCLSGNLAWSDGLDGGQCSLNPKDAAEDAVAYADALLEKLGESK